MFAPSNSLFKLFLYSLLPLALLLGAIVVILIYRWVMYFIRPNGHYDVKRYIGISFIGIVFLFHPTMIYQSLNVFQCVDIDDGVSKMRIHMEYDCYSRSHILWSAFVGLPMLVVWVIGMPALALLILFKNRKNLDDWKVKKYFLILYQGLKEDKFYWEFVNTFRKFLILVFNVFLSSYSPYYRILLAIIALFVILRIQQRIKPYKDPDNNRVEMLAIIAGIVTLYCALVFVVEENSISGFYNFSLGILFCVNAYFILQWVFLLL